MTQKYKCKKCLYIVDSIPCPVCHEEELITPMCQRDIPRCPHDIIAGIAYCPDCGAAVCPKCGCHDVMQLSRVTGYYQSVEGWNAAKKQELLDRKRYNI